MQVGHSGHHGAGTVGADFAAGRQAAPLSLDADGIVAALLSAAAADANGTGQASLRDVVEMLAKMLTPLILGQMLRTMDQQRGQAAPAAQATDDPGGTGTARRHAVPASGHAASAGHTDDAAQASGGHAAASARPHHGHAVGRAAQPGDVQDGAAVLGYAGGTYALQADGTVSASVSAGNGHGHHGNGHEMNLNDIVNAGRRLGMSDGGMRRFVEDFKADGSNYNPGQPDDKKTVGAALGLVTAMAIETMNIDGQGLTKGEVQRRGAEAVNAAHRGDGAGVRAALGGDANENIRGLTDEDLVNVWGTNTHFYNHNVLSAGAGRTSDMFQATHLLMRNTEAQDGTAPGSLVGYNDKGQWSQWGWFDNVRALEGSFSVDNYR